MNAEELKRRLRQVFGEQIIFNKEFDKYAESIKNLESILVPWCILLTEKKIRPLFPPKLKEGVVFIKKLGSSNRCIVVKMVNGEFKEVHLSDHEYYDRLRKVLGLKKDNKYY